MEHKKAGAHWGVLGSETQLRVRLRGDPSVLAGNAHVLARAGRVATCPPSDDRPALVAGPSGIWP